MKNLKLFSVIAGLLSTMICTGQPVTTGCFYIHGSYSVRYFSVVQTYDNNFVIGGLEYGFSGNSLDQNFWVFKTDQEGNLIWSSSIGGTSQDCCYKVIETSDHKIMAVGFTGGSGNQDVLVVKYDEDGNIIWSKNIDHPSDVTPGNAYANCIVETDDGFIIGASVAYDGYLIKIDGDGNKIWSKRFDDGTGYTEIPQKIIKAIEGGYTISGWTSNSNAFIMHSDEMGNIEWTYSVYPGVGFDLIQTPESDYLLSGYNFETGFPNGNAFVTKMDTTGTQIWSKIYGDAGTETFYGLYATGDGGYIGAGTEDTTGFISYASQKGYVVKCNSSGEIEWSKKIKYAFLIEDVIQTADGGFMLIGYNTIYKIDGEGNVCAECGFEDFGDVTNGGSLSAYTLTEYAMTGDPIFDSTYTVYTGGVSGNYCIEVVEAVWNNSKSVSAIYPNPVNDFTLVQTSDEIQKIELFDLAGTVISPDKYPFTREADALIINTSQLSSGMYLLLISENKNQQTFKILIEHPR